MKKTFNSLFQLLVCCCLLAFYGQDVNAQCPDFGNSGGPYVVFTTGDPDPECEAGSVKCAAFQAWGNEAYIFTPVANNQYEWNFCNDCTGAAVYDPATWGGDATITIGNDTNGDSVIDNVIITGTGCSITFTAPDANDIIVHVTTPGACGQAELTTDNGFPTITTIGGGSCTDCGAIVCDAVIEPIEWPALTTETDTALYCPTELTDAGLGYDGGANNGSLYFPFVVSSIEEDCAFASGNFGTLALSHGSIFNSTSPPSAAANDSIDGFIAFANLTQADIDNAIAGNGGVVTITYTGAFTPTCSATFDIDVSTLGTGGVDAQCPQFTCGANGCEAAFGESYCECAGDCPCTAWTDANGWDVNADLQPVVIMIDANGAVGFEPDIDTINTRLTEGFAGPNGCILRDAADATDVDSAFVSIGIFDNLVCAGDLGTEFTVTTNLGTFDNGTQSTTMASATINFLNLVDADVTTGATVATITFTTPAGDCSATMDIDLTWFGFDGTNTINAACGGGVTPAECTDFSNSGGPYVVFTTGDPDPECEAGSVKCAAFQAWGNEAYNFTPVANNQYEWNFCNDCTGATVYDATAWGGDATITVGNDTDGDSIIDNVIGVATGCTITFTAPDANDIIVHVTTPGACGQAELQTDNGFPTITTIGGGTCTDCGAIVCDAVIEPLEWPALTTETDTALYCSEDLTDAGLGYDGGVNNGTVYFPFVVSSIEEDCAFTSGNFGTVSLSHGTLFNSTSPPSVAADDSIDNFISFVNLSQADVDDAIANNGGLVTITYSGAFTPTCNATFDIDLNTLLASTDLLTLCPVQCNDDGVCDFGESYCSCGQGQATPDCPCSSWSDANGWDATSNIRPVLLLNDGTGFGGVQADVDSLAAFSAIPGPLYCQTFFGAAENNDTITLAFAVFDDLSCVGETATPYNITTTSGTFFSSGASTGTLTDATIGYIDFVQADIDASGGTTTITFDDPAGGCSANMVIDWAWFGNPSTLIADACPPPTPCAETSGSTIAPVCSGENYSIILNGCSAPSGEVFGVIYDFDSTAPTNTDSLYNFITTTSAPADLGYAGELSDCTGTGFANLIGFNNTTCDVVTVDIFLMPIDTINGLIDRNCAIEGPLTLTIYPSYEVATSDGLSCTPTANLYATYDTLNIDGVTIDKVLVECAAAGDVTTDCSVDLAYDFTTNVAAGTQTACITGDLSGTVTCTCGCQNPVTAGDDATINLCDSDAVINLNDYLSAGVAGTGSFTNTANINLDPAVLGAGFALAYEYVVTGDGALCPNDTAYLAVSVAGATTTSETFSACAGTSYDYNGTMIMAGTSFDFPAVVGANGCDSIHTVTITSIEPIDATEEATICAGDSYTASTGTVYTESGSEAIVDANNCAATLTVTITVNTPIDATEEATICAGDSYTASTGTVYTESGSEAIVDANNCAATLTVTITVNTPIDATEEATICAGDSYTASTGTVYTESGSEAIVDANTLCCYINSNNNY